VGVITNLLKAHSEKQLQDKTMALQGYQTLLSMKGALPDATREWALDNILSLTGDVTGGGGGKGGKSGGGGKDGKPNPFRSILAAMSGLNPAPAAPKPVGQRPQQMTKTTPEMQQDQDAQAAKDRTNKLADMQGEADIRRKSAVQQAGEENPILAERAGAEEAARVRANPKSAPSAEKYTPGEARYDPATKESTFPAGQKTAEDNEPGEVRAAMWAETHKTDRGPVGDAARRIISLEEKKARGPAAEGTWVPMEQNGKQVLFNPKTREVVAPPAGGELQKSGTAAKTTEPVKDALDYAQDYLSRGVFTGAGDEALQEKFFELAKPSSGFRMTKPQMDMLQKSRGWMQGFAARARHAATGQWFTDEQRQQIVDTMKNLAASKGIKGGAAGVDSGGQDTVKMRAPDGSVKPVPKDQVNHYKGLGAVVVQ
jgi:hypothetical protein